MALTWTLINDSRSNFGPSAIAQPAVASFGASDYVSGGYPVYAGQFGLTALLGVIPVGYSKVGSGAPGGYVWKYVTPAVAGPAASNPGFLVAQQQNGTTGPLVETASNTNFAGGTISVIAYGY